MPKRVLPLTTLQIVNAKPKNKHTSCLTVGRRPPKNCHFKAFDVVAGKQRICLEHISRANRSKTLIQRFIPENYNFTDTSSMLL